MKSIMFVAHLQSHILNFHLPYLKYFKEQGYEVTVCTNGDMDIPYADITVHVPFDRNPLSKINVQCYKQLKQIFDEKEFVLVHCHTPIGGALARLANANSKHPSKMIYTAHGFHFMNGSSWKVWAIFYPTEKLLARLTDTLIVINSQDLIQAKKFKLRHHGKVYYVPGVGIEIEKIQNEKISIIEKREELGLKKEDTVLISVGELNKNKNHETVLNYLVPRFMENKNLHYVICGEGEKWDYYQQWVKEHDLMNQVHFLGFRNDVIEIMKCSNLFIFPSYREGLSVALMQAIACGLPCIVSNIRGNEDIVEDETIGKLIDFSKEKEFSATLDFYLSHEDINKEVRMKKIQKYDIKNVLPEYIKIYDEVLERK